VEEADAAELEEDADDSVGEAVELVEPVEPVALASVAVVVVITVPERYVFASEARLFASETASDTRLSALLAAPVAMVFASDTISPASEVMDDATPGAAVDAWPAIEVAKSTAFEATFWPSFTAVCATSSAFEMMSSTPPWARAVVERRARVVALARERCILDWRWSGLLT
jgi:hypothetical protein